MPKRLTKTQINSILQSTKDFSNQNLSRMLLSRMDFSDCNFFNANLSYCDAFCAIFERCDLRKVSFYSANLHMANLYRADLRDAHLQSADLRNAELTEAKVSSSIFGCDFYEAVMDDVSFTAAHYNSPNIGKNHIAHMEQIALQYKASGLLSPGQEINFADLEKYWKNRSFV